MDASLEEGEEEEEEAEGGEGEEELGRGGEEEEDEEDEEDKKCLQVIRCRKVQAPSLSFWTLQAFRSLACGQKSFLKRKNPRLSARKLPNPTVAVIPFLHRSFSRGLLSSGLGVKPDSIRCFPSRGTGKLVSHVNSARRVEAICGIKVGKKTSGSSAIVTDEPNSGSLSSSLCNSSSERTESHDAYSDDAGSSSLSLRKANENNLFRAVSSGRNELQYSEIDMMKERFAKLLLGEDMSGGAKGVCTALAISNAITNLSASIFGELWRLEPLPRERKAMWRREIEWLICVSDHIVELVPSWQKIADGKNSFEVMIAKPRPDVHTNLPALRKLDAMLLEFLDCFNNTEFWYVEQGVDATDDNGQNSHLAIQREEGKWWLPTPKVASTGLSDTGRKNLQHQRECISQILKAAMEINSHVLSEMHVPDAYWDALPKNAKSSLGESIYRHLNGDSFSAEGVLHTLDLSTEHNAVEIANRLEAAIHVWGCRRQLKQSQKFMKHTDLGGKHSWTIAKDNAMDAKRREILIRRAESLLLCLRQKFPGLRQSLLDMMKIQHNRDVGQAILESYSRVMESLAFNVIARIDDVIFVDDQAKGSIKSPPPRIKRRINMYFTKGYPLTVSSTTPFASPLATPLSSTPSSSPRGASSFHSGFDRV